MHSRKKMLHLQEKSCIDKKILHLQNNLVKARNLCICNKILQKQEYLSTKCKGAVTYLVRVPSAIYQEKILPEFDIWSPKTMDHQNKKCIEVATEEFLKGRLVLLLEIEWF